MREKWREFFTTTSLITKNKEKTIFKLVSGVQFPSNCCCMWLHISASRRNQSKLPFYFHSRRWRYFHLLQTWIHIVSSSGMIRSTEGKRALKPLAGGFYTTVFAIIGDRLYIWRRPCWFHGAHLPQALAAFVGAKDQAILAGPTSMRLQDGATLLMRAWPLPFAISTIWASQFYTTSHQFRLDACEIPWTRPVHIRVGAEFANKIRFDRWPKCKLGQSVAKYSWVLRYLCSTLPAQVPEQDFHFWTSSSKAPRQGAD